MADEPLQILARLLATRKVAALGTLHEDAPYVSLVPFALTPDGGGVLVHVSQLAAHTRHMSAHPRVSLLVAGAEDASANPLATPRVTLQGLAREVAASDAEAAVCRATYVKRFPSSAAMFSFGDFRLFRIEAQSVRFVAGFAQAADLPVAVFAQIARGAAGLGDA
jgi:putative heme iron utilization protein